MSKKTQGLFLLRSPSFTNAPVRFRVRRETMNIHASDAMPGVPLPAHVNHEQLPPQNIHGTNLTSNSDPLASTGLLLKRSPLKKARAEITKISP